MKKDVPVIIGINPKKKSEINQDQADSDTNKEEYMPFKKTAIISFL